MKFSTYQFLTESFKLILENEGKNIRRAEKYIETAFSSLIGKKAPDGTDITPRYITQQIRNEIPNSRIQGCKFLLGTARIYHDAFYEDREHFQEIAQELNEYLKIIGTAHANEYDFNLNGDAFKDIKGRFEGVRQQNLAADKAEIENTNYKRNTRYEIVKIEDFKQSSQYGKYTSWCVTHDKLMLNNYTHGGSGIFYFCLRDDYQTIAKEKGENCPLDEYGKSMIAVSVNADGSLNTCTCRWNHDNGGNDSIMDTKQISELLGVNFYDTFIPRKFTEVLKKYEKYKVEQLDDFAKENNLKQYKINGLALNDIVFAYIKNDGVGKAYTFDRNFVYVYFKLSKDDKYETSYFRSENTDIVYNAKTDSFTNLNFQPLKGKQQLALLNGFILTKNIDAFTRKFNAVKVKSLGETSFRTGKSVYYYLVFSDDESKILEKYKVLDNKEGKDIAIGKVDIARSTEYDTKYLELYSLNGDKLNEDNVFDVWLGLSSRERVKDDVFSKKKNLIKTIYNAFKKQYQYFSKDKIISIDDIEQHYAISPEYIIVSRPILKFNYIVKYNRSFKDPKSNDAYDMDGNALVGVNLFIANNCNAITRPDAFAKKFNLIKLSYSNGPTEYYYAQSNEDTPVLKFKSRGSKIVSIDGNIEYDQNGNQLNQNNQNILPFDKTLISQYQVGQQFEVLFNKKRKTKWIVINKNDDGSIIVMPAHALGKAVFDKDKKTNWKDSDIRKYLNSNQFLQMFQPEFIDSIVEYDIQTNSDRTKDKFWLLSTNEVAYKPTSRQTGYDLDLTADKSKKFEYFEEKNYSKRCIPSSEKSKSYVIWLLRNSAKKKLSGREVICAINAYGKPSEASEYSSFEGYIVPACALQAKTK